MHNTLGKEWNGAAVWTGWTWGGLEMRPENQGRPGRRGPYMWRLDMIQTWWEVIGSFKARPARTGELWACRKRTLAARGQWVH